ncbi:MAG: cation-translocating P-type ATPase [Candidatus Woesearchaeota archaeon]
MHYYDEDAKEVLKALRSSLNGLTDTEAKVRLRLHGPNTIEREERISWLKILIGQFKSPIVLVLIAATIFAATIGELTDATAIAAIVILNAVLGFVQEYKAEAAIEALKQMTAQKAKVVRDGIEKIIDAREVVPGDILVLESGDKIPADARLIELYNLECQEASLTGESVPVVKQLEPLPTDTSVADRTNSVFAGTVVTAGRAKAVVTATGKATEVGKTARMIEKAKPVETILQKKLRKLSRFIILVVLGIAVITFALGMIRGIAKETILLSAIALAVAAIPEGLPAVVTISLAFGVKRMAKRNALMRSLPAVESLGACTVICADKTGTLTCNEMTVRKIYANKRLINVSGSGYSLKGTFDSSPKDFELLLQMGVLNNNCQLRRLGPEEAEIVGDPTEAALIVAAEKAGIDIEKLKIENPKESEIAFTPERKRMTTIHRYGKKKVAFTKGAPEIIVGLCDYQLVNGRILRFTKAEKETVLEENEKLANMALRVLGFAYKELKDEKVVATEVEKGMIFVGMQAMVDPPRQEVKEAIKKCKSAGIKVVMVTGDHLATAIAIAKELGIEGKAMTGLELAHTDDERLKQIVEEIGIYARVDPIQKIRIIEAFESKGHIVAMTGDGVNDAPALKKASIGIAMGKTGTDVAREASAMVIADDNFASIVAAVEEGRRIYDNIRKFFAYLFSGNLAEVLIILSSILIGLPLPLAAIHILLINLFTDGLPALALGVDPPEHGLMSRPPRKPEKNIFEGMQHFLIGYPIVSSVGVLLIFSWFAKSSLTMAQTAAFTSVVLYELFQSFSSRSIEKPVLKIGPFRNKSLVATFLISLALQLAIVYTPLLNKFFHTTALPLSKFVIIVLISLTGAFYIELHKWLMIRMAKENVL